MAPSRKLLEGIQASLQASILESKPKKSKIVKPTKKKKRRKIKSPEFVEESDVESSTIGKENACLTKSVQDRASLKPDLTGTLARGDVNCKKVKREEAEGGIVGFGAVSLHAQYDTDIHLSTDFINYEISESVDQRIHSPRDRLDHAAILLLNAATTLWMMRNQPACIFDDHSWRAGHYISAKETPFDEQNGRLALKTFGSMEINMLR